MFRHGDVLIVPIKTAPEGLPKIPRDNGRVILAYGEATGHAHAILERGVRLFREDGSGGILHVPNGASVVHEEHAKINLPKGFYRITHQREYDAGEVRRVAD